MRPNWFSSVRRIVRFAITTQSLASFCKQGHPDVVPRIFLSFCLVSFFFLPAEAAGDPQVRISGATYLANAPATLAEALGFFHEQHLDARISEASSERNALQSLRSGDADFAFSAVTQVVLDRLADTSPNQQDDPVILANVVDSIGLMQIVARSRTGIVEPRHFEGRRIAVDPGTSAEYVWWLFSKYHQLDESAIEIVQLDGQGIFEALVERRIDGAVLWEPWITRVDEALRDRERKALKLFGVEQMYSGKWMLMARRQTVESQPELCRRVIAGLRTAIEFMERNPIEARQAYQNHFGISGGFLVESWDALDYDLSLDWSLISSLQQQLFWARQRGYDDLGGSVRVLEMIDDRILRKHWPITVGIPLAPLESQK